MDSRRGISNMVKNILIFGGSGFLGRNLTKYFINKNDGYTDNRVTSVSRSETRIIEAREFIASSVAKPTDANFIVGDMADESFVNKIIFSLKPDVIIIAAAMKHIHLCEENPQQATKVNVLGTSNVVNAVSRLRETKRGVVLCFVSTDKACDPIGSYGFSKALAERIVLNEKVPNDKWNTAVRYGNVLNSPMSIIPSIKDRIRKGNKVLTLTDERMTRFIMTVEQSVGLIDFAITNKIASGVTCVPKLEAMYIKDLLEIFAEEYGCEIKVLNNAVNEKYDERMVGTLEQTKETPHGLLPLVSDRVCPEIYVTGPNIDGSTGGDKFFISNYKKLIVSKEELKTILTKLDLIKL